MRKLLVRLFNLVYLALTAVAIVGITTKPLISLGVKVTVTPDDISSLVEQMNDEEEGGGSTESPAKLHVLMEDPDSEEIDIMEYLTPEAIHEYITDFDIEINLEVPAKVVFDYKNTTALNELVKETIDNEISSVVGTLVPQFKELLKGVTKEFAKDTIVAEVKNQIKEMFDGDENELFNQIENIDEKVGQMVDDVYAILDSDGQAEISSVAEAILGKQNEDGTYSGGIKGILQDVSEIQGQEINVDDVKQEDVEKILQDALTSVPGLTEEVPVLDELGNPVIDPATGEPQTKVVINNIDSALASLLDMFMGGSDENAPKENNEEPEVKEDEGKPVETFRQAKLSEDEEPEVDEDELEAKITELVKGFIPLDVDDLDLSMNGMVQYGMLGLVLLAAAPWLLFALVTVLRTIRKRKCWTKPWIVFFFAFLEVIFGVVLTVAVSKLVPTLLDMFAEQIPAQAAGILGSLQLTLKFSCYSASIMYLIMIPLTIVYMIIAHRVKKDFKQYKKDKKLAKKAA